MSAMPWRALRRTPGFTLAAILLLAIGIGGASVVFSVTDALLLRPLAVPRPGELARVVELIPGRPPAAWFDWDVIEEFQARTRSFAAVFASAELDLTLKQGESSRPIRSAILTPNYFQVLGVHPSLGHLPTRDSDVLLSHAFWESEFHADPGVVGRVLHLNSQPFTVAGVLARDFNGISVESGPQLHLPFGATRLLVKNGDPPSAVAVGTRRTTSPGHHPDGGRG